ncbi:MAG: hypothetical protein KF836_09260 [Fimbriimonadaceae bacterium]|nr:hypothetical protein [Fimbriimonadaceae bacterium]
MLSPSGAIVAIRKQLTIEDEVRNVEIREQLLMGKVIIHGHKHYYHVAIYPKFEDAHEVRNIIDEFIHQSQDKANSVNQSAS